MTPPTSTDVVWLLPIDAEQVSKPRPGHHPQSHTRSGRGPSCDQPKENDHEIDVHAHCLTDRRQDHHCNSLERGGFVARVTSGSGENSPTNSSELAAEEAAVGGGTTEMRCAAAALSDVEPFVSPTCWWGG